MVDILFGYLLVGLRVDKKDKGRMLRLCSIAHCNVEHIITYAFIFGTTDKLPRQLNSTQLNSTQLNSTQLNSTQHAWWEYIIFSGRFGGAWSMTVCIAPWIGIVKI